MVIIDMKQFLLLILIFVLQIVSIEGIDPSETKNFLNKGKVFIQNNGKRNVCGKKSKIPCFINKDRLVNKEINECGKQIIVSNIENKVVCEVVDVCEECKINDIGLTTNLMNKLDPSGKVKSGEMSISWSFNDIPIQEDKLNNDDYVMRMKRGVIGNRYETELDNYSSEEGDDVDDIANNSSEPEAVNEELLVDEVVEVHDNNEDEGDVEDINKAPTETPETGDIYNIAPEEVIVDEIPIDGENTTEEIPVVDDTSSNDNNANNSEIEENIVIDANDCVSMNNCGNNEEENPNDDEGIASSDDTNESQATVVEDSKPVKDENINDYTPPDEPELSNDEDNTNNESHESEQESFLPIPDDNSVSEKEAYSNPKDDYERDKYNKNPKESNMNEEEQIQVQEDVLEEEIENVKDNNNESEQEEEQNQIQDNEFKELPIPDDSTMTEREAYSNPKDDVERDEYNEHPNESSMDEEEEQNQNQEEGEEQIQENVQEEEIKNVKDNNNESDEEEEVINNGSNDNIESDKEDDQILADENSYDEEESKYTPAGSEPVTISNDNEPSNIPEVQNNPNDQIPVNENNDEENNKIDDSAPIASDDESSNNPESQDNNNIPNQVVDSNDEEEPPLAFEDDAPEGYDEVNECEEGDPDCYCVYVYSDLDVKVDDECINIVNPPSIYDSSYVNSNLCEESDDECYEYANQNEIDVNYVPVEDEPIVDQPFEDQPVDNISNESDDEMPIAVNQDIGEPVVDNNSEDEDNNNNVDINTPSESNNENNVDTNIGIEINNDETITTHYIDATHTDVVEIVDEPNDDNPIVPGDEANQEPQMEPENEQIMNQPQTYDSPIESGDEEQPVIDTNNSDDVIQSNNEDIQVDDNEEVQNENSEEEVQINNNNDEVHNENVEVPQIDNSSVNSEDEIDIKLENDVDSDPE